MSDKTVKSNYSLWSIFIALFGTVGGVTMSKIGLENVIPSPKQDIALGLASILIGIMLMHSASISLFARYKVTLDGISVKNWWNHRYANWKDVSSIGFQTYWGWGYTVGIKFSDSKTRNIFLAPSLVGNNHNIVKAIIEAATLANPNIRFVRMHEFGPPPYGIFSPD